MMLQIKDCTKYFQDQRLANIECWGVCNDNHERLQFDEFAAFLEKKFSNHMCCLYIQMILDSFVKQHYGLWWVFSQEYGIEPIEAKFWKEDSTLFAGVAKFEMKALHILLRVIEKYSVNSVLVISSSAECFERLETRYKGNRSWSRLADSALFFTQVGECPIIAVNGCDGMACYCFAGES